MTEIFFEALNTVLERVSTASSDRVTRPVVQPNLARVKRVKERI